MSRCNNRPSTISDYLYATTAIIVPNYTPGRHTCVRLVYVNSERFVNFKLYFWNSELRGHNILHRVSRYRV